MKISAIVVTHNKKNCLYQAIMSLSLQTHDFEELIIIDNNSNDGTEDFLVSKGFINPNGEILVTISNRSFIVRYIYNSKNIGGAGGFCLGQKLAIQNGAEYIWFIDDDAVLDRQALEYLCNKINCGKYDILNPVVIDIDDESQLAFGLSSELKSVSALDKFMTNDRVVPNLVNPFNGTFMSTKVVKKIGLVKKEMFIWGDEQEYIERARLFGLNVATIVDSKVFHPKSKTKQVRFLFGLLTMEDKPINLRMNYFRNKGYLAKKYGLGLGKYNYLLKGILYFLIKLELRNLIQFIMYFLDGYLDRYSLPAVYKPSRTL